MGAWIEIFITTLAVAHAKSLPTWERGLKYLLFEIWDQLVVVAPYMGAWIEIIRLLNIMACQ